jgi:release factor glutamine methyltransferase
VKGTDETWTTLKVLTWTSSYLAEKGLENARREAEWMLCSVTGLDRVGLYLNFDKPLNEDELTAYRALVARRAKREPLQYLLGSQEFDGLDFVVSPSVLIPRHDTETLLEAALSLAPDAKNILDIGTGSGCIAISIAKRLPDSRVSAIDISPEALAVARKNAELNSVTVEFLQGSFFAPVAGRRFDLILSNPPYITTADLATLQPEVRDHEPKLALDGGPDGLDAYRVLAGSAVQYLNKGGWLMLEIGVGQSEDVARLLASAGLGDIFFKDDNAAIQRVVGGRLV